MSVTKKISLALIAGALAFGAMGTSSQANAGGLSTQEKVLLAGAGGFVLDAIIGSQRHHGHRRVIYVNSWEAHVARCLARYQSYDPYTDSYLSYSGNWKRCLL